MTIKSPEKFSCPAVPRRGLRDGKPSYFSERGSLFQLQSGTRAHQQVAIQPEKRILPDLIRDLFYDRVKDRDLLFWPVVSVGLCLTDLVHDIHAFCDLPEDRMFAVEEIIVHKVDEEL